MFITTFLQNIFIFSRISMECQKIEEQTVQVVKKKKKKIMDNPFPEISENFLIFLIQSKTENLFKRKE